MVKFNEISTNFPYLIGLDVECEMVANFCIDKDSELENFLPKIRFKLSAWSEKEEEVGKRVNLAYINLIKIPSNYRLSPSLAKNYDMFKAMEEADCSDLSDVKDIIFHPHYDRLFGVTEALKQSDLYHISEIYTGEKYRGKKIGARFLELLPELIKNYFGDENGLLTLKICPIDVPDGKTRCETFAMLEKFYTENNFHLCGNDIAIKKF